MFEVNEDILTLVIGERQLFAIGIAVKKQACFAAIRAEEITLEKGTALHCRNHQPAQRSYSIPQYRLV